MPFFEEGQDPLDTPGMNPGGRMPLGTADPNPWLYAPSLHYGTIVVVVLGIWTLCAGIGLLIYFWPRLGFFAYQSLVLIVAAWVRLANSWKNFASRVASDAKALAGDNERKSP